MKKIFLATGIFFSGIFSAASQNTLPVKKTLIFSAIKGTVSNTDSMMLPASAISVKLFDGDTASFRILSHKKGKLVVVFQPSADFIGITKAKLKVKNPAGKS